MLQAHAPACRVARTAPHLRIGFTLIECLVVIGVIGLLAAILLPAVQAAREAGRRAQCLANLRQIGLAIHGYHAALSVFPTSQLLDKYGVQMNGYSELAFILPFLEQRPIYDAINFDFAVGESGESPTLQNHTARNASISVFLCPSDGGQKLLNSYRFNRGRYGPWAKWPTDGPFGPLSNGSTITDGLAQTAFVSERVAGNFNLGSADRIRNIKYFSNPSNTSYDTDAELIPLCLGDEPGEWVASTGRYWLFSGFAFGHYNHNGAPNDRRPSCMASNLRDVWPGGLSPPRSYHSGGVNVLFGDGRVQAIPDGIESRVWTAMGSRNNGD